MCGRRGVCECVHVVRVGACIHIGACVHATSHLQDGAMDTGGYLTAFL